MRRVVGDTRTFKVVSRTGPHLHLPRPGMAERFRAGINSDRVFPGLVCTSTRAPGIAAKDEERKDVP